MKIEIWSDVMCPFCYIGKKNFENALEELSLKDKIDVEWKSFQLDPSLEMGEAITTAQYFKEKKGFPENQRNEPDRAAPEQQEFDPGAGNQGD